jgi:hypothetical protein
VCRRIFAAESSLLENVQLPSVFVGDIHGDLQTLLNILTENGLPPTTNYVFLGDYVDRCVPFDQPTCSKDPLDLVLSFHEIYV